MIRKYWWLVVFAVFVFLFDTLLMQWIELLATETDKCRNMNSVKEGANKQVISSQADSLIKISRIWADFFPVNTSNQPI